MTVSDRYIRANRHVALKILIVDSYGGPKEIFELSILKHGRIVDKLNPGINHVLGFFDHYRHKGP